MGGLGPLSTVLSLSRESAAAVLVSLDSLCVCSRCVRIANRFSGRMRTDNNNDDHNSVPFDRSSLPYGAVLTLRMNALENPPDECTF